MTTLQYCGKLLLLCLLASCGEPDDKGTTSSAAGNTNAGGSSDTAGSSNGTAGSSSDTGGKAPTAGSNATAGTGGGGGGTKPLMPTPVGETPEAKWVNVTGSLAGLASECGNLGRVAADPRVDLLVVGVAKQGLFGSDDGGVTWTPLGATGDSITNRISYIAYDPTSTSTFWESGIYNGGGVYKTTDSGKTFTQVGDVVHCDSVSIDFSDPARKTMLAGSHEQSQRLFRSTDAGATWQDIGKTMPDGSGFCTTSLILDSKTFLVGCGGWYGGNPGIQRSVDGGEKFTQISDAGVIGQPLLASDGTIYWAGHQQGGLYKSTDHGESFSEVADASKVKSIEPIELPDGRIVSVGPTTLVISDDGGATWEPLGDPLPFTTNGVTYSAFRNAFYIWQWDCEDVVLPNAIMRFGFDYRK